MSYRCTGVYRTLRRNGVFVIGLFIAARGHRGPGLRTQRGHSCDAHYGRSCREGRALFVELIKTAPSARMFTSTGPANKAPGWRLNSRKSFRSILRVGTRMRSGR